MNQRVRIVGAGLTGLAAAWRLTELGVRVEIADAAAEPGGMLQTIKTPQGIVERAANAFVSTETALRFFGALGIHPLSASKTSNRRFVFRNGRARRWPLTPLESLAMTSRGLAARLSGRLRPHGEESVASWSNRVWGRGATKWLISPGLQGIYGTSAERLTAAAIFGRDGSRLPAGRRRPALIAPRHGMGELIERLVDWLKLRGVAFSFGVPIASLDPSMTTIVCTNAQAAGRLIEPHAPTLGATLRSMPMTSLITATAFFAPHSNDLHGFGVLFPRGDGVNALGALFNADIFSERSSLRSETWISRLDDGAPPSDAEIARALLDDREILTGRRDTPVAMVATKWPAALPVYGKEILEAEAQLQELPPWLRLAGNYLGRIGVSRLVEVAIEVTREIRNRR